MTDRDLHLLMMSKGDERDLVTRVQNLEAEVHELQGTLYGLIEALTQNAMRKRPGAR